MRGVIRLTPCFCVLLATEQCNRHVDLIKGEVCHIVNRQDDRLFNILVLFHLFFAPVDKRCNGIYTSTAAKARQQQVRNTPFRLRAGDCVDFDFPNF